MNASRRDPSGTVYSFFLFFLSFNWRLSDENVVEIVSSTWLLTASLSPKTLHSIWRKLMLQFLSLHSIVVLISITINWFRIQLRIIYRRNNYTWHHCFCVMNDSMCFAMQTCPLTRFAWSLPFVHGGCFALNLIFFFFVFFFTSSILTHSHLQTSTTKLIKKKKKFNYFDGIEMFKVYHYVRWTYVYLFDFFFAFFVVFFFRKRSFFRSVLLFRYLFLSFSILSWNVYWRYKTVCGSTTSYNTQYQLYPRFNTQSLYSHQFSCHICVVVIVGKM